MKQTKDKRPNPSRRPSARRKVSCKPSQTTKDLKNIEIACHQNLTRINYKNIRIILRKILHLLGLKSCCISVVFCDNKFISGLNRKFFRKSQATDVISFPLQDDRTAQYLGEIAVSVEQAKRMCDFYGKKWQEELVLYLIHGILHLIGYNDIKKKERMVMERKQEEMLSKILQKHKRVVDNIGK